MKKEKKTQKPKKAKKEKKIKKNLKKTKVKKSKIKNNKIADKQFAELKLQLEFLQITIPKITNRLQFKMNAIVSEFLNLIQEKSATNQNSLKHKNKYILILNKVSNLKVNAEKGRIKDLRKIQKILEEIKSFINSNE